MKQKFALIILSVIIVGCASNGTCSDYKPIPDPLEKYNRFMFKVNMKIDKTFIRPITVGYTYIPYPIRAPINNFFNNLRDFISLANDILQLKGMATMQTTMRISLNSVVGLAGLIDVASSLGLPQQKNSFGKTLQVYGWQNSSYFVIPLLGPSTIRDTIGLVPDVYFNPTWYLISDNYINVALYIVNLIDIRSKFLDIDQELEKSSLDLYTTVRDSYLQSVHQETSRGDVVNINDFLSEESSPESSIKN
ncbi:MAG TPA: VacJ family lipoprotein [Burkholderiales bacterium]|nr:VacJ family lipoprotein [Burkholderiales bacterium]